MSKNKSMKKLNCKPNHTGEIFKKYNSEMDGHFSLRSIELESDGAMLFNWATQPYAQKFWQMKEDPQKWRETYRAILESGAAHAFAVCFDEEPIGQFDVYLASEDELRNHVNAQTNDAGFHLLMGPPREMQKGFSFYAIRCLQEYYFSFEESGDLYCEPDQHNYHANRLAINAGFQFMRTIQLSYKTANLYRLTRQQFLK